MGDNITKNAVWSSSTRFAGIQYASNFEVDPDLITTPLLVFEGKVTLPSAIDIYSDSKKIYTQNVESGIFQISDLIVPSGAGEITIETKDINGKIQTITVPYYKSIGLLKKDIDEYSFSIGKQRREFGKKSNSYSDILLNADYMRGINDHWTSGAHLEVIKKHDNANLSLGITNIINLGFYGTLNCSIATNLHRYKNSQKYMLTYDYSADNYRIFVSGEFFRKEFLDVFSGSRIKSSKPRFRTGLSLNLQKYGSVNVNYNAFSNDSGEDSQQRILTLNYSKKITKSLQSSVRAGYNLKQKDSKFIIFSFDFKFNNYTLSSRFEKRVNGQNRNFSINGNHKAMNDKLSYSFSANNSGKNNNTYNLYAGYDANAYDLDFSAAKSPGNFNQQMSLTGAVVLIDKSFFFTKKINSNLALVKIDNIPNIPVRVNNRSVAETDKYGRALLTDLPNYNDVTVSIDDYLLPMNTTLRSDEQEVFASRLKSIELVFDIKQSNTILMTLIDENGEPLEDNYTVDFKDFDKVIYSGYHGQLYVEDMEWKEDAKYLEGVACKFDVCYKFKSLIPEQNPNSFMLNFGDVQCEPFDENNEIAE